MNNLILDSIDFVYDDGKTEMFTNVKIRFTSINDNFKLEGDITVNRNDYKINSGSVDDLKRLVLVHVLSDFGQELV